MDCCSTGYEYQYKMARRYHIHNNLTVEKDPHSGIACNSINRAINLVDYTSKGVRKIIIDIVNSTSPNILIKM